MKKLFFFVCLFWATQVVAQENLKNYLGVYKFEGSPIDQVIVSMKDGKLYGNAGEQGTAELQKTTKADG